jgi:probable rRNA maturation factor
MSIEIANESGAPADEGALAGLARHVLDEMRVHPLAELSVLLVDKAAMTELHVRWMGEPGPTDVLAFPMDELRPPQPGGTHTEHSGGESGEIPGLLGDVVICPQVAAEQAREAAHDAQDEMELLAVHGILHLLGYDHADTEDHAIMFGLQDRLLASWRSEHQPGGQAEPGPADQAPGEDGAPGAVPGDHAAGLPAADRSAGGADDRGEGAG